MYFYPIFLWVLLITGQRLRLRLDFTAEQPAELAVTWVLGMVFFNIWEARKAGKRPELYTVRADLESKVSLLRQARRFTNDVTLIQSMLDFL